MDKQLYLTETIIDLENELSRFEKSSRNMKQREFFMDFHNLVKNKLLHLEMELFEQQMTNQYLTGKLKLAKKLLKINIDKGLYNTLEELL